MTILRTIKRWFGMESLETPIINNVIEFKTPILIRICNKNSVNCYGLRCKIAANDNSFLRIVDAPLTVQALSLS